MKTLYVSDLDGTLITRYERISPFSLAVLNDLTDRGLLFTYATARSPASAESAVYGLKHSLPVISYNGALIIDLPTQRVLYSSTFSYEQKKSILAELNAFGVSPIVHGRIGGADKVLCFRGRESAGQLRYLSRRSGRTVEVDSEEGLLDGEAYFLACNGEYARMSAIHDRLERLGIYTLLRPETYQSDYWLEILPPNATKAKAALRLKSLLSADELVCFGDSANDSELFDVSDRKYAVQNADEWLKGKATGVIGYCEEDGVAKFLKETAFR